MFILLQSNEAFKNVWRYVLSRTRSCLYYDQGHSFCVLIGLFFLHLISLWAKKVLRECTKKHSGWRYLYACMFTKDVSVHFFETYCWRKRSTRYICMLKIVRTITWSCYSALFTALKNVLTNGQMFYIQVLNPN